MRRNNTVSPLLWAALTLPVLYLAALLASGYEEGMTVFDLMGHFSGLLERPFAIRWTPHTPKFMLGALLIYGFSVVLYCSTRENRRPGEEHGSAKWGSPKLLDRKYRDKAPFQEYRSSHKMSAWASMERYTDLFYDHSYHNYYNHPRC